MSGALSAWLPDGRLHLQHGPIDLMIGADGDQDAVAAAAHAMIRRFGPLLAELVDELTILRSDARTLPEDAAQGSVAQRVVRAARTCHDGRFLTPMAAVAGAVADEIADVGWAAAPLVRLHVNNGGDVAVRQTPESTTVLGVVFDLTSGALAGRLHIAGTSPVRGVATSGRGGRSLSLGIADGVTVLAGDAATADALATVVANRVDLPGHPAVLRRPANEVRDDSDLGSLAVACSVGPLTAGEVAAALDAGEAYARGLLAEGRIAGAVLALRGSRRIVGQVSPLFLT